LAWHPKGDYFATVLDDKNSNSSVIMHQLSRTKSVRPFAKMSGIVQQVAFHPSKPILFVAVGFFYSFVLLVILSLANYKRLKDSKIREGLRFS